MSPVAGVLCVCGKRICMCTDERERVAYRLNFDNTVGHHLILVNVVPSNMYVKMLMDLY